MSNILLVIAEHEEGRVRRGSLEALSLARRLAAGTDTAVHAAILGDDVGELAAGLAAQGADTVHAVEDPRLAPYTADAYGAAISGMVRDLSPEWVLMAHTYLAQDTLPLVAARLDAPVVSDCVDAERDGDRIVWVRQPYDAKYVAKTVDSGPAPRFATLQAGAFPADDLPDAHGGKVEARAAGLDGAALGRNVLEVKSAGGGTVDLSGADVVVAGGRGLQDKEKFEAHVNALADVLGGAIGASRPVVDSDWLPHEYQIGSSGQIVAPKLYVALGISGAIQHMVGVRGAQVIVAVNKDKEAPIFNEATYGIVGDVFEIVPELIKAIEEAKES